MSVTTIERRENRYYGKTGTGVFAAKAKQQNEGGGRVWVPSPKAEGGGNWKYEQEYLNAHVISAKISDTKFGPQFALAIDGGDGLDYFQVNLNRDNGQVNDDFAAVVSRIRSINLDKKLRITSFKPKEPKTYEDKEGNKQEFFPQYLVFFQGRNSLAKGLKYVSAEDAGEEHGYFTLNDNRVPSAIFGKVGEKVVVDHSPVLNYYREYVEAWIAENKPTFDARYATFLSRFGDDDESFDEANARALDSSPTSETASPEPASADVGDGKPLPF